MKCLWVVSLALLALARVSGGQVTGRVETDGGLPVAAVRVTDLLSGRFVATSSPTGDFSSAHPAPLVLLLERPEYAPAIRIVQPPSTHVAIRMRPDSAAGWTVPPCRGAGAAAGPREIRFRWPRGVKRLIDADFHGFEYSYPSRGTARLESMTGTSASRNYPPAAWVRGLNHLTVRRVALGSLYGLDIRGQTADGSYSRWLGYFYSFAAYSRAPKNASTAFDRIMESACWH